MENNLWDYLLISTKSSKKVAGKKVLLTLKAQHLICYNNNNSDKSGCFSKPLVTNCDTTSLCCCWTVMKRLYNPGLHHALWFPAADASAVVLCDSSLNPPP